MKNDNTIDREKRKEEYHLDGYKKSFAQMTLDEKNKISHRAIAIKKLVKFLNKK